MYQLFKRDFFAMHKQSLIGLLWIFVVPIINVVVFAMLGRSGIFNFGDINVPYPLYAVLGLSFWQIFANGIISCGASLMSVGDMVTRINFSKKSVVLASMGRGVISFSIQLSLVIVLFIIFRVVPAPTALLMPLFAIPIILLTAGLGLILALLNSIIRDTGNLLSVSITFFMYLTPVLYAKPKIGLLASLTNYNPMYYLIAAGRDTVLFGHMTEPVGFLYSSIFSVFVFIMGLVFFHLTETRIAERI
jgi:lipopolysaccharide transport system permease protein